MSPARAWTGSTSTVCRRQSGGRRSQPTQRVRSRIGYVSQLGGADELGTGAENLILKTRLYGAHIGGLSYLRALSEASAAQAVCAVRSGMHRRSPSRLRSLWLLPVQDEPELRVPVGGERAERAGSGWLADAPAGEAHGDESGGLQ